MSTSLTSRSLATLSELAQAEKRLTISDIHELVIPILLNIPEDVSKSNKCSQMVLRRLKEFKEDVLKIKDYFNMLTVLEYQAANHIKVLLQHILDPPFTVAAFTDDYRYRQLNDVLIKLLSTCKSRSPGLMVRKPTMVYGPDREPENFTNEIPGLNPFFQSASAFRQFSRSYELLEPLHKACLLCFSAFPENAEIKKRTVIYWWIGQELIVPPEGDDGEEIGHEVLRNLVEHGFVEDVIMKDRVTSSCRVRPFIRSVLIYLASAASFFDYLDREYDADDVSYGNKRRVCLVKAEKDLSTPFSSLQQLRTSQDTELERIETLFNVNKSYLDIKLHWFSKMKSIKAVYLGRCHSKTNQHIEVKSTKFLAGLTYMKGLRFLSLQGISKIIRLPDSIGLARSLRILDLRHCNDMEDLPEAVKSLHELTHLDLSGCYSLARLPKGIASLRELRVLKGFLIREDSKKKGDSCSVQDIKRLTKLRKLSITTSIRSFPTEKDLTFLSELKELRKLTIAWRGLYRAETAVQQQLTVDPKYVEAFLELEKLDLQHIPYEEAPAWLVSDKLRNLKKLYIKGGKFLTDLGKGRYPWAVEILRFKYLRQLSMDRTQLQNLFPHLTYLEIVNCPKLTSIPCSDEGVWRPRTGPPQFEDHLWWRP